MAQSSSMFPPPSALVDSQLTIPESRISNIDLPPTDLLFCNPALGALPSVRTNPGCLIAGRGRGRIRVESGTTSHKIRELFSVRFGKPE